MPLEESTDQAGREKVDYDRISSRYDRHRRGGGPYLDRLVALARESAARHVLEIGTGTGNNAHAFLNACPCALTALEPSSGMLAQASAKCVRARWVQGSAMHIPLAPGCVDFVFGVYVLHHLPELEPVLREVARVLGTGFAVFVTASPDFIDRHPMNEYFPSFAAIDKARFQPIEALRDAFERTGFRRFGAQRFTAEPRPIDREYVARVADKFISTYELIPPDEFAQGLKRLSADVARKGRLDTDIVWESLMVTAYRA